jgi:hypothetical protein
MPVGPVGAPQASANAKPSTAVSTQAVSFFLLAFIGRPSFICGCIATDCNYHHELTLPSLPGTASRFLIIEQK